MSTEHRRSCARLRPTRPSSARRRLRPRPSSSTAGTELVVDLLEATGLLKPEQMQVVRDRTGPKGSVAQAILDEGFASPEGMARILASRYQLPLVDLLSAGVSPEAAKLVPAHVLERVVAIPYALEGETLMVALADPGNVQGIDELRLATRYSLSLAVASREDIEAEIRRLVRANEAFGAAAILDEADGLAEERRRTATTSRSTTASRTCRSSGS